MTLMQKIKQAQEAGNHLGAALLAANGISDDKFSEIFLKTLNRIAVDRIGRGDEDEYKFVKEDILIGFIMETSMTFLKDEGKLNI